MQPLSVAKKLLPGILFLLLAVFAPLPRCVAVEIEEIYDDDAGEGFLDETELTQTKKTFLSGRGNDAETLGEARKNAFGHAASILESTLTNTNTIRISVKFEIPEGEEDPDNPGECLTSLDIVTVASARPTGHGYFTARIDRGDANRTGSVTYFPLALAEAISGQELNDQDADMRVRFSKCIEESSNRGFYYGFTGSVPSGEIDFVQIALHEIMHGIGFLKGFSENGNFPLKTIQDGGETYDVKIQRIYDEQLYSETDDDLLINITSSKRAAAIISGTGLLWEGTDGGRERDCSFGQRMAELKSSSAKSGDGKPGLYAPSTYESGGSVSHVHRNAEDIMEPFYPFPKNMDLTLGMLKDMGWSISADGFPPDCEPTGITVGPTSGLVTTEGGEEAKFEVKLESEPLEDVVIPLTSSRTSEGVPDSLELTFTPQNWDTPQEVTVTGVDDDLHDGPQDYFIILEKAESDDKFYDGFTPQPQIVSLRNEDNDFPSLIIEDSDAEEGEAMDFTVTLSPQSTQTVTVEYTITGGTAQEGSDYTASPSSGTLTFAPGETQKTIGVRSIDDNINEPDEETLTVTLSNPQNAVLNRNRATGIIKDNDSVQPPPPPPPPAVTVSFGSSFYSVTEGEMVAVRVTLSEDPERTVTIPITIDQTTTAATEDYSLSSTSVTFASGETSKDITLTATDDDVDDDGEVVVLAFGTLPQRVSGGSQASATVTIRDINSPRLGAEAGENRMVAQREEVILKGSAINATFGEPTYQWTYTGTRNDIELRNPDSATCAFTAPDGLSEDAVLVFRLVVENSRGASAEDTVSITVTNQKIAFSSKNAGGTVTLGDGSTVELTVNRDAGSPPGNPVIILSPDLVEDIDEITFHISVDLPEAPPSGLRLEGFVAGIELGVELGEGKTVTVCLPAPLGTQNPALYHYDEESGAWELLESRSETVDGTPSVCAETDAFSLFGVFVAERSEPPVNTPPSGGGTEGGGGCSVAAGAGHGFGSAAVNLLLIAAVLFTAFFRKSRLTN